MGFSRTGPAGPAGATGATGATGAAGATGATGATGAAGSDALVVPRSPGAFAGATGLYTVPGWFGTNFTNNTTNTTANALVYVRLRISVVRTYTKMSFYVISGTFQSIVRGGVYPEVNGLPGATLIADWGTAAIDTSSTQADLTISWTPAVGYYWLVYGTSHATGLSNFSVGDTAYGPTETSSAALGAGAVNIGVAGSSALRINNQSSAITNGFASTPVSPDACTQAVQCCLYYAL